MTPQVLNWTQIERRLRDVDVVGAMEQSFVDYSAGRAVIPPVGEMQFDDPPGDVHIKCGYLHGGSQYVVKIAAGFYQNPKRGLPSSQGVMLLFEQQTGRLSSILLDEGHLTDVRTGAAGAVAARHLANPTAVIGIVGTGTQALMQARFLRKVTESRALIIWGRNSTASERAGQAMTALGYKVRIAKTPRSLAEEARLIQAGDKK